MVLLRGIFHARETAHFRDLRHATMRSCARRNSISPVTMLTAAYEGIAQ